MGLCFSGEPKFIHKILGISPCPCQLENHPSSTACRKELESIRSIYGQQIDTAVRMILSSTSLTQLGKLLRLSTQEIINILYYIAYSNENHVVALKAKHMIEAWRHRTKPWTANLGAFHFQQLA